jgi:glycerol-3-phosphate dehydrogenase
VTGFSLRSGRIETASARDRISNFRFDIRAKAFVNAGGPWVDRIAALDLSQPPIRLRPTKGVHVVTRRLTQTHALLLQARRDRRVFFVLPWGANHSLVGTTDTDFPGDPDRVEAKCRDTEYLLEEANHALPGANLTGADVRATFAGLRPLLRQDGRVPSDETRRHQLTVSSNGLISIVGGKYTTYRAVAQEVVDIVCRRLKRTLLPCRTAEEPMATQFPSELPTANLASAVGQTVHDEMAMTVGDFLFRRTTLGYTEPNREKVTRQVADEMQKLLGWTEDEKSRQVQAVLRGC